MTEGELLRQRLAEGFRRVGNVVGGAASITVAIVAILFIREAVIQSGWLSIAVLRASVIAISAAILAFGIGKFIVFLIHWMIEGFLVGSLEGPKPGERRVDMVGLVIFFVCTGVAYLAGEAAKNLVAEYNVVVQAISFIAAGIVGFISTLILIAFISSRFYPPPK